MAKHQLFTRILITTGLLLGGVAAAMPAAPANSVAAASTTSATPAAVSQALKDTTTYVKGRLDGFAKSDTNMVTDMPEWLIVGYARSGADTSSFAKRYLSDATAKLKQATDAGSYDMLGYGGIRATDNSRIALAVTALGGNAENLGGNSLFDRLNSLETVTAQGINGAIYTLLAIDANPTYKFSPVTGKDTQTTKQALVDYILGKEVKGGGWNLFGSTADIDITAMALQALAPYKNEANVKSAIDRAVSVLSKRQDATGGYTSYGTANVESADQVIVALTALGIDPQDTAFTKNGKTLIDNLMSFHVAGSGFAHTLGDAVNDMATEQSYYAIVAYNRFLKGETSLYDMSDLAVTSTKPAVTTSKPQTTTKPQATEGSNDNKPASTAPATPKQQPGSKDTDNDADAVPADTDAKKQNTDSVHNNANKPAGVQPAAAAQNQAAKHEAKAKSDLPQLGSTASIVAIALGLILLVLTFVIGKKVRFDA
ncbi:hypothetical protein [Lacticaseibacillus hulanensis]|uniref:hypothetical protein n=1 Tax=Lacticaseibacillus hulanensis TaxID=2493111 RepID=UPI000FD8733E|nr:hypothetical protein [Lacticaseibacillus hulanensis]